MRHQAFIGGRYGSKDFSSGLELTKDGLSRMWMLRRVHLHESGQQQLLLGAQLNPRDIAGWWRGGDGIGLQQKSGNSSTLWQHVRPQVFCEYRMGRPDSRTSVALATDDGRVLEMSAHYHLARIRRMYNLFEDPDVIGVTNYLDFCIRMRAPLEAGSAEDGATFEAAAAWQV
jgi:hypothetical protein